VFKRRDPIVHFFDLFELVLDDCQDVAGQVLGECITVALNRRVFAALALPRACPRFPFGVS
jgi:hypothetical protein